MCFLRVSVTTLREGQIRMITWPVSDNQYNLVFTLFTTGCSSVIGVIDLGINTDCLNLVSRCELSQVWLQKITVGL